MNKNSLESMRKLADLQARLVMAIEEVRYQADEMGLEELDIDMGYWEEQARGLYRKTWQKLIEEERERVNQLKVKVAGVTR